ncbi:MAG: hypothetical protein QOG46_1796 [Pseudonocardiales bacterium]|jgi:hypothetical protein|nr:hypothetical protein [Pseudonocardiales bacterium]
MATSYHQRGMIAQYRGRWDDAEDWYHKSLTINEDLHLADLSSDLKSATGPRWVSLSGLTIELMLVI